MIEFLKAYWKEIIELTILLVVTLITIFKKKVKVISDVKGEILSVIPKFVNTVERDGDGHAKLKEVIDMVYAYLQRLYPGIQVYQYTAFIRQSIESVLSTPQKKAR